MNLLHRLILFLKTSNDVNREYVDQRSRILKTIVERENVPSLRKCSGCGSTHESRPAQWRCHDCFGEPLSCSLCLQQTHDRLPFHRVSRWNGKCFYRSSLLKAGVTLNLGHGGSLCPKYATTLLKPPFPPTTQQQSRPATSQGLVSTEGCFLVQGLITGDMQPAGGSSSTRQLRSSPCHPLQNIDATDVGIGVADHSVLFKSIAVGLNALGLQNMSTTGTSIPPATGARFWETAGTDTLIIKSIP